MELADREKRRDSSAKRLPENWHASCLAVAVNLMPSEPSHPPRRPSYDRSSAAPCILLAEDDVSFRQLLAESIREDGYQVMELRNGTELIQYMASTLMFALRYPKPALIITDLSMPGFNGLEIIAALKRARLWTKSILITGFGSVETHSRARHLGVEAVFDKPFDIDELRVAVKKVVPLSPEAQVAVSTMGREPSHGS